MAEKSPDLSKMTTPRLLALLKAVRKCRACKMNEEWVGYPPCKKKHPSIEAIKKECAKREHVAR